MECFGGGCHSRRWVGENIEVLPDNAPDCTTLNALSVTAAATMMKN
jgi:hypothetical protein